MGTEDNTAFVRAPIADVERALQKVFEDAGRTVIRGDVRRVPLRCDPMEYGNSTSSGRWAAAVFEGPNGWCAIKTAPFELLCESDGDAPRLATLTKLLACDGFQLNIFERHSETLVEAQRDGEFRISGFVGKTELVHGADVAPEDAVVSFSCLQLPKVNAILAQSSAREFVARVQEHLLGTLRVDNSIQVQHLIPGKALPSKGVCVYGEAALPAPVSPLEFPACLQDGRLRMEIGGGVLHLQGERLRIEAPAQVRGVLSAFAEWLDVPAPKMKAPAGPPKTVIAYAESLEQPGSNSISFSCGRLAVPFQLTLTDGLGRLEETSPFLRRAFIDGLQRDWAPRARFDQAWCSRFDRVPVQASRYGYKAVVAQGGLLVASKHAQRTCLNRHVPGRAPQHIAEIQGAISRMSPSLTGVVAFVAEHANQEKSLGNRVIHVDSHGHERTLLERRTDLGRAFVVDAARRRLAVLTRPPLREAASQALDEATIRVVCIDTGAELASLQERCWPLRWLPRGELLVSTKRGRLSRLRAWSVEHGLRELDVNEVLDLDPEGAEVRLQDLVLTVGGARTDVSLSSKQAEYLTRHGISWVGSNALLTPEPDPERTTSITDLNGERLPIARSGMSMRMLGVVDEHIALHRDRAFWWGRLNDL